ALVRQYQALLETEGIKLDFTPDGLEEIAETAVQVNDRTENIGARRLFTIMERLLEQVSFDAPELTDQKILINAQYVKDRLKEIGMEAKFRQGVRITDRHTMEVVEMVLGGKINKEIVTLLNQHGARAVGLTGKDGGLILSKPLTAKAWAESLNAELEGSPDEDFGRVGEVQSVNPHLLVKLQQDKFIPVIAPIGTDRAGGTYNINADLVAGAVAAALKAEKLLVLTDVK